MAIVTFLSPAAIHTESNTVVEGVYMNDPLEHDVYKPVNISHPCYFVLFASYFCHLTFVEARLAGFSEFIAATI